MTVVFVQNDSVGVQNDSVGVQNDGVGFYQAWQKNVVMLSLSKHLLKNGTVTLSEVEGSLEGLRVGLRFFTSFRMTVVFVQNDGGVRSE